jgi:hypothetical protein
MKCTVFFFVMGLQNMSVFFCPIVDSVCSRIESHSCFKLRQKISAQVAVYCTFLQSKLLVLKLKGTALLNLDPKRVGSECYLLGLNEYKNGLMISESRGVNLLICLSFLLQ